MILCPHNVVILWRAGNSVFTFHLESGITELPPGTQGLFHWAPSLRSPWERHTWKDSCCSWCWSSPRLHLCGKLILEDMVSVFLLRKTVSSGNILKSCLEAGGGGQRMLAWCPNRTFNRGRGWWFLESLGGACRGRCRCRVLLLLIDVLNQHGVHDLPLPVFSGCQLRIIQQLVNHGQVMFFTL